MEEREYLEIGALGLQHFCIKHKDSAKLLRASPYVQRISGMQNSSELDFTSIYSDKDDSKNFVLLTDLNDWSYLIWGYWGFDEIINTAKNLSDIAQTVANYYFTDPWIATSQWTLANKGVMTRAYFESHGQIIHSTGFSSIEENSRINITDTFGENLFCDVYENTCTSIELINSQHVSNINLYTGTFNNNMLTD